MVQIQSFLSSGVSCNVYQAQDENKNDCILKVKKFFFQKFFFNLIFFSKNF
jgi:hypothetical protein